MGRSNIIKWEEIVFENRNKAYGAYVLRYAYPRHVSISALIVISLFLTVMVGMNTFGDKKKPEQKIKKIQIIDYKELSAPPPIEKKYAPPEKVVIQKVKVEKYVAPVVVQEKIEEPEEVMTVEEAKEAVNPPGISEDTETSESFEGFGSDIYAPPEPVFDVNPHFPGGRGSFLDWLAKNLKYPLAAKRMGIEGTVIIEFLVDENGNISEATVSESLHRLCDREAMRLIKIMPPWVPGVKNGIKIRGRHTLEIPFVIE